MESISLLDIISHFPFWGENANGRLSALATHFWSLLPFTKVACWYRFVEPQPCGSNNCAKMAPWKMKKKTKACVASELFNFEPPPCSASERTPPPISRRSKSEPAASGQSPGGSASSMTMASCRGQRASQGPHRLSRKQRGTGASGVVLGEKRAVRFNRRFFFGSFGWFP